MKKILETRLGVISVAVALYSVVFAFEISNVSAPITGSKLAAEALELALLFTGIYWIIHLAENIRRHARERTNLLIKLQDVRNESNEWRTKAQAHLAGLVASIHDQCDRWGLTPAEKDVSLLMLKGLSHKEIAILRDTHESTVRQQARSIYSKAGMNSRRAFCAYFLDDLLPSTDPEPFEDNKIVMLRARDS